MQCQPWCNMHMQYSILINLELIGDKKVSPLSSSEAVSLDCVTVMIRAVQLDQCEGKGDGRHLSLFDTVKSFVVSFLSHFIKRQEEERETDGERETERERGRTS